MYFEAFQLYVIDNMYSYICQCYPLYSCSLTVYNFNCKLQWNFECEIFFQMIQTHCTLLLIESIIIINIMIDITRRIIEFPVR